MDLVKIFGKGFCLKNSLWNKPQYPYSNRKNRQTQSGILSRDTIKYNFNFRKAGTQEK